MADNTPCGFIHLEDDNLLDDLAWLNPANTLNGTKAIAPTHKKLMNFVSLDEGGLCGGWQVDLHIFTFPCLSFWTTYKRIYIIQFSYMKNMTAVLHLLCLWSKRNSQG